MDKVTTDKREQCIWIDYFPEPVNDSYQKRCRNAYTHKMQTQDSPNGGHYCDYHIELLIARFKEASIKNTVTQYVTQEEYDVWIAEKTLKERLKLLHTMPYHQYLQTPEWKERRLLILERDEYRCMVCNSSERLNVHHRDYTRRGYEQDADLVTLCQGCHKTFHDNGRLARVEA